MKDKSVIKGRVVARVFDKDGNLKRRSNGYLRVLFAGWKTLGELFEMLRYEVSVNHNIVTNEGDAMIADIMAETPARVKVNNANGHIQVGTGWTGTTPKANTVCNTATGSPDDLDATFPKVKGAFGAADDNVTQYRATFAAGTLNATGINEAALLNHATPASADCLAYAQITPSVNVGLADTLQLDWELTYVGT